MFVDVAVKVVIAAQEVRVVITATELRHSLQSDRNQLAHHPGGRPSLVTDCCQMHFKNGESQRLGLGRVSGFRPKPSTLKPKPFHASQHQQTTRDIDWLDQGEGGGGLKQLSGEIDDWLGLGSTV